MHPPSLSPRLRPFRPTRFGRYTLLAPLSFGGMGEVYLARLEGEQGFEKLCVIKKILPHLAANPQFVERFCNEARTLVQLSHGSIAQVLDLGEVDGEPYLAIEHVDGKDMRKVAARMRERGMPTPLTLVLYVMSRTLDALGYAHRKRDEEDREIGLVHRDVSPQNILVSYEGEVKVIDFGLAKSSLSAGLTSPSIVLGNFFYMSPEQARNAKLDRRSDIYSAGLCLYELISGKNPFENLSGAELIAAVSAPNIAPLRTLDPLCPAEIESIVMKALAVDPAQRFQTAEALRGKLQACLNAIDPSAGPETTSRCLREAFATEYQQERKFVRALRELRRPEDSPPASIEVDPALALAPADAPQGRESGDARTLEATASDAAPIEPMPLSFTPTPRAHASNAPTLDGETLPSIMVDDSLTLPSLPALPPAKRAELNWAPPDDPARRTMDAAAAEPPTQSGVSALEEGTDELVAIRSEPSVEAFPLKVEPAEPRVRHNPSPSATSADLNTSDLVPIVLSHEVSFASQTLPLDDGAEGQDAGGGWRRRRWLLRLLVASALLAGAAYVALGGWGERLQAALRTSHPSSLEEAEVARAPAAAPLPPEPAASVVDEGPAPLEAKSGPGETPASELEGAAADPAPTDDASTADAPGSDFEPVAELPREVRHSKKSFRQRLVLAEREFRELQAARREVDDAIGCQQAQVRKLCLAYQGLAARRGVLSTPREVDAFIQEARALRLQLRRHATASAP